MIFIKFYQVIHSEDKFIKQKRVNYIDGHCGLADFSLLVTEVFFLLVQSQLFAYVTDPIHIRIEMTKKPLSSSFDN
jgi:hypothetical protein